MSNSNKKLLSLQNIINNYHGDLKLLNEQQFKKMVLIRLFLNNSLAFILQFAGLAISTLSTPLPFIWFASGTSCALCFLKGPRILPGIFLGSWLAYYLSNAGLKLASTSALLFVLQIIILLKISYLLRYPSLLFYKKKHFIQFILMTIIFTGIFSLCLNLIGYPLLNNTTFSFWQTWICWWLANLNGTVIFSLALMFCDAYFPESDSLSKQDISIFTLYCLISLVLVLGLLSSHQPILIILFITLICFMVQLISLYQGKLSVIFIMFLLTFSLGLSNLYGAAIWHNSFAWQTILYIQITIFLIYIANLFYHCK